ncbi:MAG: DNA primase [Actinomycetia bacterium]|nr:DNA primase [Actinomycetes bacterium]
MGRISDEDVQRVRDATDLVELVSESVVLKKRGRLFWGNCPFHAEKTPSFKVDPATQLWHCFGCSAGGDAFGYVMRMEGLDFPDAVRRLAERARIEITEEGGPGLPTGRKERLIAACEAAADYYHKYLVSRPTPDAAKAREYLAARGFGIEVAKRWRLGFAPKAFDEAGRLLLSQGFRRDELIDANLVVAADRGEMRDRFYNRVMFPISDLHGRVIAFGGRIVGPGGPQTPKYLNSNETPIFRKANNLYGIDRARASIVTTGTAVVVEGYTDVISLAEAGIPNVVATLGTALGEAHVRLLGRFAKRVVYLFDGDPAGIHAASRAIEFLDASITPEAGSDRKDLAVAIIPDGLDPADFVAQRGVQAMREVIDGAMPLLQFAIEQRLADHNLNSPEGKANALRDAARVLTPIRDSILAQEYAQYIADRLLTDVRHVRRAISSAASKGLKASLRPLPARAPIPAGVSAPESPSAQQTPEAASEPLDDVQAKAERELLQVVAVAPHLREKARDLLDEEVVLDRSRRELLGYVIDAGGLEGQALYDAVAARDREAAEKLTGLLVDAPVVEQIEYRFRLIADRLKEYALGRLILAKQVEFRALDPVGDNEVYDKLFREIADLQRQQKELRDKGSSPAE